MKMMEARPEFSVIAGPNGAGKSMLCPYYIHGKSFDGDLLALNLRKDHPDWEERWIAGTVVGELQKQKENSISQHNSFAFETNFSSDMILEMIADFKEAGYKICLYYFGLFNIDDCCQRVDQRVCMGGHNVDAQTVQYNFTEGISRMQQNLHLFDDITFIDSNSRYGTIIAHYIRRTGKHEISVDDCQWFNTFFKDRFEAL
jgi:predicted ABC-type ATPase